MFLLNWAKKRLGYHVCEEFTQWEQKTQEMSRPTTLNRDGYLVATRQETIEFTRKWQERRCTLCGLTQQKNIDF